MSEKPMRHHPCGKQAGYSLVELMVAMVIALFLLGGMFSILQGTRDTSNNQTALAQLQDNERMAITIMTDVIQEAGYYPGAATKAPTDEFLGTAPFSVPGQVVVGDVNPNGTSLGETVTVGYQPDSTGTVLGCTGSVDTPLTSIHTYQFLIKPETVGTKTVNTLECIKDGSGTAIPLVSDVSSISFAYGVASAGATSPTNTYVTAATLNGGTAPFDWSAVRSVKMTLTFPNPLYGQPGQTAQTISFTRVVSVMSRNGVNVN
jgi:type IV pilus assembly protein PilW